MQGGKEGLKFDKRIQTVLLLLAMAVKAAAVPTPDSVIPKLKDSKYFRETFFHIVNRDEQTVPFEQNVAQSKYYVDQSDDDLILKARHLGFSSEIEGDFLFDCMSTPNTNAVTMAHTLDDTHVHMQRIKYYIKSMRNSSNPIEVPLEAENRIELYLPNQNSYYWIGTAGATGWGRGRQVTRFHGCLAGDVLVQVPHGGTKSISEIKAGDEIFTHTGKTAIVRSLSKRPCSDVAMEMREIVVQGLHNFPIKCTPDHKFLVRAEVEYQQRARPPIWKEAKDIGDGDMFAFPRRDIGNKKKQFKMIRNQTERADGGNLGRMAKTEVLKADHELGFCMGLYLAEGSVKSRLAWPVAVVWTLDKDETIFVERIQKRLGNLGNVRVHSRKNSRSINVVLYNSALARTFAGLIGKKDGKQIPDYFWGCKREFLNGLVEGYILGDGHLENDNDAIRISSVRPQLVLQLRDLLMSLGFGWSSIYKREAGRYYDRNCRGIYTLSINGRTAAKLRNKMGWPLTERINVPGRHWRHDRNYSYARLVSNKTIPADGDVYDIVLDDPDHSFRIVQGVSHNSEVAHWKDQAVLTAVLNARSKRAKTRLETTANGMEKFAELWFDAEDPAVNSPWKQHFFAWWMDPETVRR